MRWKSPLLQLSLIICLTGFFANQVFAQDTEPAEKEPAVQKQTDQETDDDEFGEMSLEELGMDFKTKMRAYTKRYRAAPTKAEKSKVARTIPTVEQYQTRLIELINEEPGSEAGLKVIDWWYRRGRRFSADTITRVILQNYAQLETMKKYVPRIVYHLPKEEAEEQLRVLVETNPFDSVKGSASYWLQDLIMQRVENLEDDDAKAKALLAEAKVLQESIYKEYPDAVDAGGAPYAALLDAKEFAPQLEIGKPVPDIAGIDLDGVPFKLSDYAGNVRVISFWGDW